MRLQRLSLHDFRNFETTALELASRFTVLAGPNGAGKTNVLEAIYFVSTVRSFRSNELGTLIRHGRDQARVDLRVLDAQVGVPGTLSIQLRRTARSVRRTAEADGKTVRAARDFYGRIRAILFTPEDLGVLRGGPSGRRQLLDRILFARDRAHIADTQTYDKLVRSRNRLLRQDPDELRGQRPQELLATYEAGLASTGARIWNRRAEVLDQLREPFRDSFARIHGPQRRTDVEYRAKLGSIAPHDREQALVEALAERRIDDMHRGGTSMGPHRDDLLVELDGRDAGEYASQGQARALVLALKLAELRTAHARTGSPPLLLLDDVSSELDPPRTAQLFATLAEEAGQCILTTTDPRYVALPRGVDRRVFDVEAGTLAPHPESD